jgi:hypothetical protein
VYWVVQKNFYSGRNHSLLVSALQTLGVPFEEVALADILASDGIAVSQRASESRQDKIIACGSTHLLAYAKSQGWEPGSFLNEEFSYKSWLGAYGENFLNYDSTLGNLSSVEPVEGKFFIRPLEDNKVFDGMVIDKAEFESLRQGVLSRKSDLEVVIAPCKTIYAEYRFFALDGVIISASQYKLGQNPSLTSDLDVTTMTFAKSMVERWSPARAFVLDIALTPEGYKVVELNSITSSGFYACDATKIVDALENMTF